MMSGSGVPQAGLVNLTYEDWIPAFAGMTNEAGMTISAGMTHLDGFQLALE